MVRDITLGQYLPGSSFVHRMDARSKILLLTASVVFIFLCFHFASLLIMTGFTFLVLLGTRISLMKYLKSLRGVLLVIVVTGLFQIFYGSGEPLFEWYFLKVTMNGLVSAAFIVVRISILMMISATLTYTTSPTDLTDALEWLMKPLKLVRVPVNDIAMMMTIALRFIPVLLEETDKIMNAQKARGADMESGNLFKRIKALVPVLIPLFVSAFRRAGDLATAMECRCYDSGAVRTRMKVMRFGWRDLCALLICLTVYAAVLCCGRWLPSVF